MKLALYFVFLATSCFSSCLCILDPEKLALIDDVINDLFIPANHVTGLSLSVVLNGETVIAKGYGKMDIENNLDVQNDTLFSIGSITKSFIGILVVKTLSEKYPTYGEAILDVPIAHLNPGFNNFNFTFSDRFRSEQTTFRDLLSHRTCLIDEETELVFGSVTTNREYNYRTRYQKQSCGHRSGHLYNNALFALAGDIIASFESSTLEVLVKKFMVEIGMEQSTTIDYSGSYENLPNMSKGYYRRDGQIGKFNMSLLRRMHIALGAGGILSTASDMAKYMTFHLNKGKVGNKQVVSEEALSWLYKPSIQTGPIPGKQSDDDSALVKYAYGLGIGLGLYDGYSVITHGGHWPPYQSGLFVFPAKGLGVFLVTNGPGYLPDPVITHAFVATSIFDIINGVYNTKVPRNLQKPLNLQSEDLQIPFMTNLKSSDFMKNDILIGQRVQTGKGSKIEFEDVVGFYGDDSSGDVTVSLDSEDNNFLEINLGEWSIGRLIPLSVSDTKFYIEWKTDIMHHYYALPIDPPVHYIDFFKANSLHLIVNDVIDATFIKNARLDTFPAIPWDPTSCSPK